MHAPTIAAGGTAAAGARGVIMPWYVLAALFGAASIAIGTEWDISWHMTIGRDTLWSPPHMAMYLGGIVAGLSSGWVVLRTSFRGSAAEHGAAVRFWGFRGPLGAWVCIWGAFAMLTSAPLDDWWHNAYGLDVRILSPPHVLLALGTVAIFVGALLLTAAEQNRAGAAAAAPFRRLYGIAAGLLIVAAAVMTTEYSYRVFMRSSIFYKVTAGVFPLFIVAAARSSGLRWPATTAVAVYTAFRLAMVWTLPLFPAQPGLGPIFQDVTHMVPMDFPLLLIVPAVFIDLVMRRSAGRWNDWFLAPALGLLFLVTFLAAQWPFAGFLMSPASHNWFFAGDNFWYGLPTTSRLYRMEFLELDGSGAALLRGLGYALLFAMVSARVGLLCGGWLAQVRR